MITIDEVNNCKVSMPDQIFSMVGGPAALEQLAEEATELAQAALKLARIKRGENYTPVSEADCIKHVIEEVSDVQCVLNVLNIQPDTGTVYSKMRRWYDRLCWSLKLHKGGEAQ